MFLRGKNKELGFPPFKKRVDPTLLLGFLPFRANQNQGSPVSETKGEEVRGGLGTPERPADIPHNARLRLCLLAVDSQGKKRLPPTGFGFFRPLLVEGTNSL